MAQSLGMGKAVMLHVRPDMKKVAPVVKKQEPVVKKEAAVVKKQVPVVKKQEAPGKKAQPAQTSQPAQTVKTNGAALKRSAARKKTFVLDEGLRKQIRQEAAQLKMSEEEYLRLMLHFSEVVRTSVLPAGLLDGGLLKMLLGNPMAMGMLKNMIGNMVSRFGSGGSSNATPGNAMQGMRPGGAMGGNPMMPMRSGSGFGGIGGGMNPMFPQARAGQMGNPMGNMMYGMNGPGMGNMNGGGGQRPMQGWPGASGMPGMPGMSMNPGGGQTPQQGQRGGGGLSNLFSMDNLSQMFMQFFGNQGATS